MTRSVGGPVLKHLLLMVSMFVLAALWGFLDGSAASAVATAAVLWPLYLLLRVGVVFLAVPDARHFGRLPIVSEPLTITKDRLPEIAAEEDGPQSGEEALTYAFVNQLVDKISFASSEYAVRDFIQSFLDQRTNESTRRFGAARGQIRTLIPDTILGVMIGVASSTISDWGQVLLYAGIVSAVIGTMAFSNLMRVVSERQDEEMIWIGWCHESLNRRILARLRLPVQYSIDDEPLRVTQEKLIDTDRKAVQILESIMAMSPQLDELLQLLDKVSNRGFDIKLGELSIVPRNEDSGDS